MVIKAINLKSVCHAFGQNDFEILEFLKEMCI